MNIQNIINKRRNIYPHQADRINRMSTKKPGYVKTGTMFDN